MPWLAGTVGTASPNPGVAGRMFWWGPEQIGQELFHPIAIPAAVNRVDYKGSFATGHRHCYMTGNFTDNLVLTDDFRLWTQGIQAPTLVPDVALSGIGLTGDMICYLAYYDQDADVWSPLGAPSATLNAVNQGILWSTLPVSPNPRVTHIGLWRSVDGGLPRLVQLRQVGVLSVQESVPLGDLGEAWVDTFDLFPRCRYNVIWHERQVMAGDDDNPDTIYLSLIGDAEKYSTLNLRTKSGQPVVGLIEVGGTLLVLCPRAVEIVSGWTEDDLAIEIIQHGFGGIGHHATVKFHNYALIWSHLGAYMTDGSGWWQMYQDIRTKWADEYERRRPAYDIAWAVHDPVAGGIMLHVGEHSDTSYVEDDEPVIPDTFWFADYSPVIPQLGGGYAQPFWSYDTSINPASMAAGALLAVPSGRRQDLYYGACDGLIYRANPSSVEVGFMLSPGDMRIRTGAMGFGDEGGDIAQGKKFTNIDLFVKSEDDEWTFSLYGGDEHAFPAVVPAFTKSVPASLVVANVGPDTITYQPKTVHTFNLSTGRVIGRRLVVDVTMPSGEFRGIQPYWYEGETQRVAISTVPNV